MSGASRRRFCFRVKAPLLLFAQSRSRRYSRSPAASRATEQTPSEGCSTPCRRLALVLPSSADEVELVHRLRRAFVQVAVHQFSGDPIEAAGAADDVQSGVVWPNAATDLNIPEATDLTIEVIGPPTPQSFVWPDLAQTVVTTGPVVAMVWVEQLSLEPERLLAWQLMEARLFKDPEVVIERGRGWGRE